jgi:hypothetical protein
MITTVLVLLLAIVTVTLGSILARRIDAAAVLVLAAVLSIAHGYAKSSFNATGFPWTYEEIHGVWLRKEYIEYILIWQMPFLYSAMYMQLIIRHSSRDNRPWNPPEFPQFPEKSLHQAIVNGNWIQAKQLLVSGSDPNQSCLGYSPLAIALAMRDANIERLLRQFDASELVAPNNSLQPTSLAGRG